MYIWAVHRHFEGQWPKPKKGALFGWVLVNTNLQIYTTSLRFLKIFNVF